jgi:4-hydroxy-tetrahydrodipicolinate synthase
MSGVLAPVVTPFRRDLLPDGKRLVRHCRWLLERHCGLAVFGTNSEANSLSVEERIVLLDLLLEAGLDPKRMMPGTGCCSIPDTVRLTSHALKGGVGGVLMLPPFYYKGVSDEGLFRSFARVIDRVGDDRLRIYLYHFPQMSAVPISIDLVGRLRDAFPGIVVGMKDSSGDRAHLEAIDRLFQEWQTEDAEAIQASLNDVRLAVQQFPLVPALKKIVSHYASDPEWNRLRPPLVELGEAEGRKLISDLEKLGFDMPGL